MRSATALYSLRGLSAAFSNRLFTATGVAPPPVDYPTVPTRFPVSIRIFPPIRYDSIVSPGHRAGLDVMQASIKNKRESLSGNRIEGVKRVFHSSSGCCGPVGIVTNPPKKRVTLNQ